MRGLVLTAKRPQCSIGHAISLTLGRVVGTTNGQRSANRFLLRMGIGFANADLEIIKKRTIPQICIAARPAVSVECRVSGHHGLPTFNLAATSPRGSPTSLPA